MLTKYADSLVDKMSLLKLITELKCGGSESFSTITINHLVGACSNMIIEHGGTSILIEVPKMFGSETISIVKYVDELFLIKL